MDKDSLYTMSELARLRKALTEALRERTHATLCTLEQGQTIVRLTAERNALRAKLADDALVDRVVRATCQREANSPRRCIEAYRAALRKEMGDE